MIDVTNRRTCPKRCVSHPVSGTEMALATANEVMTHVPWFGATPRSPEMAGIDTLAMDVSSTFMKVASDSATVPIASLAPVRGGSGRGAAVAMGQTLGVGCAVRADEAGALAPVAAGALAAPRPALVAMMLAMTWSASWPAWSYTEVCSGEVAGV